MVYENKILGYNKVEKEIFDIKSRKNTKSSGIN